jgi:hypothetical protein
LILEVSFSILMPGGYLTCSLTLQLHVLPPCSNVLYKREPSNPVPPND